MPELPEVEIIKIGLEKRIVGLKLTKIQINSPKSFQNEKGQPFDYTQDLQGRKVLKVWRRAKILGIDITGNLTLLFHLKMSGQLVFNGNSKFIGGHPTEDMTGDMPNKHTRVIFSFSDGSHLFFNDQRKFGWIKIVNRKSLIVNRLFEKLGPEPLEKSFTWQILKSNLLNHKSQSVKAAIMDQSVVSGIGNIYANEACFDTGINPATLVSQLSDEQFKKLYYGIVKSLKDGIKFGGSTRANFVDSEGQKGYYLDYAYCYGRNRQKCKMCGTQIKKISLGGRGTYFCPNCQR